MSDPAQTDLGYRFNSPFYLGQQVERNPRIFPDAGGVWRVIAVTFADARSEILYTLVSSDGMRQHQAPRSQLIAEQD